MMRRARVIPAPALSSFFPRAVAVAALLALFVSGCPRAEAEGDSQHAVLAAHAAAPAAARTGVEAHPVPGAETGAGASTHGVAPGEPGSAAGDGPEAIPDAREPGALSTVPTAPVVGRTGPGGHGFEVALRTPTTTEHARRFGKRSLPIALRVRSPVLTQFPCTGCHVGSTIVATERIDDAHAEIQPLHPAETGAACATCHDPANVELLALGSGERATLDHAYRLCAECHSTEVAAWANGAHGKRLDGWRGRRVVMGCADCHDPHRPATESRTPFRAPRLHRTGSNEP